jgi:hypothetical protein
VRVNVRNGGDRGGQEVVQLYVDFPPAFLEPPAALRGFEKRHIPAGETATFVFALTDKDTSVWDIRTHGWRVCSGSFTAHVGASSQDLRLSLPFEVDGDIFDVQPSSAAGVHQPSPAQEFGSGDAEIAFKRSPKTGCQNWESITIAQHKPGQGNCEAFCGIDERCSSYNTGTPSGRFAGHCTLFANGCVPQSDPEWDLHVRVGYRSL